MARIAACVLLGWALVGCGSQPAPGGPDLSAAEPDLGGAPDLVSTADAACAAPDAGWGAACVLDSDCPCNLRCAARTCVRHSNCDEVLLTFNAPTTNSDGSCATDLAGFKVYWGTAMGGPYPNSVDIGKPCVVTGSVACGDMGTAPTQDCAYRLGGLAPGTYYFVVESYNTQGVQSAPSGEASATLTCP